MPFLTNPDCCDLFDAITLFSSLDVHLMMAELSISLNLVMSIKCFNGDALSVFKAGSF